MKRTQSLRRITSKLLAGAVILSVPVVALAVFGGNALALFTTPGEPVAQFRILDMTAGEQSATDTVKPAADPNGEIEVQIAHWENTDAGGNGKGNAFGLKKKLSGDK